MTFNNTTIVRYFLAIFLIFFIFGSIPQANAGFFSEESEPTEQSGGFLSKINLGLKDFFFKSVEQKKEYLERNRDIRNKLIEETTKPALDEKLNIKFNQKKAELAPAVDPALTPAITDFTMNIEKLEEIRDRLDMRLNATQTLPVTDRFDTRLLSDAKNLIASSTVHLENARANLDYLATSTPTTTTKAEIAADMVFEIKTAREALIEAARFLVGKE
jgi:hypothetical protein